ncbi:MAG: DUF3048 domain-containing protein [Christensenellaceae bacterium]
MKKSLLIALAILMAFSVLAGCSPTTPESPAQPTKITSGEDKPIATPAPETPSADIPENVSPTTGMENTTTTYKPVMVQIDNEPGARPQTGVQNADVVYETPIEGSDTRLTLLFNDAIWSEDGPEELVAGPVRSSRYYHQWIQGEWDALYVHMGGPDKTNNPTSDIWGDSGDHVKQRINGAGSHSSNGDMFYPLRSGQSVSNYAAIDVKKAADIYKYEPTQKQEFTFYPLEAYDDAPEIDKIELAFMNKPGWVEYQYDKDKDKLIRYMSGKEFIAEETGEPVEVQNLIIAYTTVTEMPNDAPRRQVDVIGEGPAEFVVHGKHLKGTWSRPSGSDPTTYTLENGEDLVLTPGNTWIEIHPNNKSIVTTYTDGKTHDTN